MYENGDQSLMLHCYFVEYFCLFLAKEKPELSQSLFFIKVVLMPATTCGFNGGLLDHLNNLIIK